MIYMEPDDFGPDYKVCQCDKCGDYTRPLYWSEDFKELCKECLAKQYKVADKDECDGCGEYDITCYEFDGECLCPDCIAERTAIVEGSEEDG